MPSPAGKNDRNNMKEYISKALRRGDQEYDYRWFCYGGPDVVIDLPAHRVCFLDDQGNKVYRSFQGKYQLDLPEVDVFSSPAWGDLYRDLRDGDPFRGRDHEEVRDICCRRRGLALLPTSDRAVLDPQDGKNYLQELDEQLEAAFRDGSSWLKPALDSANEVSGARDGLAQAAMDFMDQRWTDLLLMNRSVEQGAYQLSWTLTYQLNGNGPILGSGHGGSSAHNLYGSARGLLGRPGGHPGRRLGKAAPIHERLDRDCHRRSLGVMS